MRAPLLVISFLSLGCGSTVVLSPSADGGPTPTDQGVADGGASDAPAIVDGPAVPDAGVPSLNGRWRMVRFEFDGEDGVRRSVTDVDGPVTNPLGETVQARGNGTLSVADDRLALTAGTLINGHFYTYATGYSANGFGVAGLLDQATGRFTLPGSSMGVTLQRNDDGTVSLTGDTFGASRLTYARDPSPALVERISTVGVAMIREMPAPTVPLNLRVALFWDHIGAVPDTETNGVAVRFAGRYASYPIVLAGPPPAEVRSRVGVANVALARIALYIDQDASLTFNRTVDRPVAISPVGIAWRDDTPGSDAVNNPVRDLSPGYQYVHIHGDTSLGRPAVTPFDNANLVAPDMPVVLSMSAIPVIPDVL